MNTFRKLLAQSIWIVPLVAWMSCGVIFFKHENDVIAKGECLKTFTVEHWHKHSPPTYTTHTVMLYANNAYVVPGTCDTGAVSWSDTHKALTAIGVTSVAPWFVTGLVIVAGIIYALIILYKYIYPQEPKND